MNKLSLLFSLLLLLTATTVYCQKATLQGTMTQFYTPLAKPLFTPLLDISPKYTSNNLFLFRKADREYNFLFIMPSDNRNYTFQSPIIDATNFLPNSNNILENLVQVAGLIVLDRLFLEKPLKLY
jgi:hypothetical protein